MIHEHLRKSLRPEEMLLAVASAAKELRDQLANKVVTRQVDDGFENLRGLIEALPITLDRGHICFMRNWASSSHQLWEANEVGASSYQLSQIELLLNRLSKVEE